MRKILIFILALMLAVTLVVCIALGEPSSEPGNEPSNELGNEPGITGYVMKIDEGRILIIEPEAQDVSSTGGIDEFYNAIWFSNAPQDITIGQKVKVWFDIVKESYPGQSVVEHIEIISRPQPDGANLDESQALYKALTSQQTSSPEVAVKSIEYNNETSQWVIELKTIWDDETYTIEVDDK